MEQIDHPILQITLEVDHHVAAHDQHHLPEHFVRDDVVLRKHHVLAQRGIKPGRPVLLHRVVSQTPRPSGRVVVALAPGDGFRRVDSVPGPRQGIRVDVGGVDLGPIQQAGLLEQDGHRIHLFTRRTAGMPDFEIGVGAQDREHLLPNRGKAFRIAKGLRHIDRNAIDRLVQETRLVQQAWNQLTDALQLQPFG